MPALATLTCSHFGVCGGCTCAPSTIDSQERRPAEGEVRPQRRPAAYESQLAAKEARVRELLSGFDVGEWRPIVPSPETWFYRNKMEFAFAVGWETPDLVLGLREAGRFDRVVDVQSCLLMSPEASAILNIVRSWAKEHALTGYHRGRHQGDLRYLVLREAKNTGQRMAVLITSRALPDHSLQALREKIEPLVTTFLTGATETKSDVARAEETHCLWGAGTIEERLNKLRFEISPYSFFQTNTHGTEKLYALLEAWAREGQAGALVDLYCGAGGIALSLAHCFDRVIGIDTNRGAIGDAGRNAERNGIGNAEFVCEDALEFLKKLPASKLSVQLAAMVVDPPRPGLHPKALQALLEMNPARLAYVSCSPESLARDLGRLAPLYHIRSVQPVDLFPQTPHTETVVFLEHR
jgi:23S rRNA (uracil1939-C5)-methyltransferase